MILFSSVLTVSIFGFVQVVSSQVPTPTPTIEELARRADPTNNGNIPTFTFRPIDSYFLDKDSNPQPQGDKLDMFPRGFYDDFPSDGITIAFGPDLQKRIRDAIGDDCNKDPDACRKRLAPVIHSTDIGTHVKRMLLLSMFMVATIVQVTATLLASAAIAGTAAWLHNNNVPSIQYEYSDLAQMDQMGNIDTFAAMQGPDATPSVITIPNVSDAPTPTATDQITIETVTADSGQMKQGDVVYHIPADEVSRLQDMLATLGMEDTVNKCKGHSFLTPRRSRFRRADNVECAEAVQNMATGLLGLLPDDALVIQAPDAGQVVPVAIPNMVVNDAPAVVMVYRVVMARRGQPAPPTAGPNIGVAIGAGVGLAIAAFAAYNQGQLSSNMLLPKSSVSTDTNADLFKCRIDMLCLDKDCGAQVDDVEISLDDAYCKTPQYEGCYCEPIYYPHHTDVQAGYMEAQFAWLDELLELSKQSLSIGMKTTVSPHGTSADISNKWQFFTTTIGHAVGCDQKSDQVNEIFPDNQASAQLSPNVDTTNIPWPGGEFRLPIGGQKCTYMNNGQNPGRIWCDDKSQISCTVDGGKGGGGQNCDGFNFWHPVVFCDFPQ